MYPEMRFGAFVTCQNAWQFWQPARSPAMQWTLLRPPSTEYCKSKGCRGPHMLARSCKSPCRFKVWTYLIGQRWIRPGRSQDQKTWLCGNDRGRDVKHSQSRTTWYFLAHAGNKNVISLQHESDRSPEAIRHCCFEYVFICFYVFKWRDSNTLWILWHDVSMYQWCITLFLTFYIEHMLCCRSSPQMVWHLCYVPNTRLISFHIGVVILLSY